MKNKEYIQNIIQDVKDGDGVVVIGGKLTDEYSHPDKGVYFNTKSIEKNCSGCLPYTLVILKPMLLVGKKAPLIFLKNWLKVCENTTLEQSIQTLPNDGELPKGVVFAKEVYDEIPSFNKVGIRVTGKIFFMLRPNAIAEAEYNRLYESAGYLKWYR